MKSFRRRNKKIKEYSGYNEVSEQLRNRVLNCVSSYIGVPKSYLYGTEQLRKIYRGLLNDMIDEEYGTQNSDYSSVLRVGKAEDVFTVVEMIISLGHQQLDQKDFIQMIKKLVKAFNMSGSVYELGQNGKIVLKLEEDVQEEVDDSIAMLDEFDEAKNKFQDSVARLVERDSPTEVVKDAYLSLEKYVKEKAGTKGKNAFDEGVTELLREKPVQKAIVKKLKGFKGNAKDLSHDGNYVIDQPDALWYVRSIGAVIYLIEAEQKTKPDEEES